ncbi:MAG: glycosyltransferase involved in cell wall biosynthesis [Patiriisocius sp.]|jgi:glycosyltransferase involved in cell wall biosynthesis
MNNPVFTIVIPTYNRGHLIEKTINSLLNQTYSEFEILVIDDGSTDNTEEVVREINDSRLQYFKKKNEERAAARNYGREKSIGDYINFFDSDDLAYPNHLHSALEMIKRHNNPESFHLNYDFRDSDHEPIHKKLTKIEDINKQLVRGNLLSCNGVFIRKDIAEKNPFNQDRDLSASEDYLLWLTLASKYKIHSDNNVTSSIVDHEARSVFNINLTDLVNRKELMLKYLFDDPETKVFYAPYKARLTSGAWSYIGLHSALDSSIKKSVPISYLWRSILILPSSIFMKRTLATIKNILFNNK